MIEKPEPPECLQSHCPVCRTLNWCRFVNWGSSAIFVVASVKPRSWPRVSFGGGPGAGRLRIAQQQCGRSRLPAFLTNSRSPCWHVEPGACGPGLRLWPGPALARCWKKRGAYDFYDPFFYPDDRLLTQRYDFVTCTEVVEHLHHPAEVFANAGSPVTAWRLLGIMTCFQTDDAV